MSTQQTAAPRASLSIGDGIAMMVGLIIGVGIFKLPFLVALNVDSTAMFLGLWGSYGKNDSVDVQFRRGGRDSVATGLEIIPPDQP